MDIGSLAPGLEPTPTLVYLRLGIGTKGLRKTEGNARNFFFFGALTFLTFKKH
jgi:hypothetical protein